LYAAAFAEQPQRANEVKQGHRYNAACAAVLAAAGRGPGADTLQDEERARLRRQALGWLRADLALLTSKVLADSAQSGEGEKPKTLPQQSAGRSAAEVLWVENQLTHWKGDPDLAGVRAAKGLAQLPAEEQNAWQKLWADVEQLRNQARARFTETQL